MNVVTSRIACNPANVGEVFGCLGLMEIEHARAPASGPHESTGQFIDDQGGAGFVLHSVSGVTLQTLIQELVAAELHALRPVGSDLTDKRVATIDAPWPDRVFPAAPPDKASALPIELRTTNWRVVVSSWAESGREIGRDNAKFWAGNYTGASVSRLVLDALSALGASERGAVAADPWSFAQPLSSSYRLDFSRDYIPLDSGFSPNRQPDVRMVGHPLVELLAAVGLEHARPMRGNHKLAYRYGVPRPPVSLTLMRAALSGGVTGLPTRRFGVSLGWPGQENQARCIVRTFEESPS